MKISRFSDFPQNIVGTNIKTNAIHKNPKCKHVKMNNCSIGKYIKSHFSGFRLTFVQRKRSVKQMKIKFFSLLTYYHKVAWILLIWRSICIFSSHPWLILQLNSGNAVVSNLTILKSKKKCNKRKRERKEERVKSPGEEITTFLASCFKIQFA